MNTFLDPTGVSNFLPAHNLELAIVGRFCTHLLGS
jgi:hypothetical protein